MGTTYTALRSDIQAYIEDDGTEFVAALDGFIRNSEYRIYREADLNVFRKISTASLVTDNRFLAKPTDFVIDRFMSVNDGTNDIHLLPKAVSFINTYWPDNTASGTPRYYAEWDHDTFIFAPTPSATLTLTLGFTYRPTSLVDTATTSWLSDNAADVFLYACLVEAYGFKKAVDEPDIKFWKAEYDRALAALKFEEEKRQRHEEYRFGVIR